MPEFLLKNIGKDDLVITLGAGDIYKYGEIFIDKLKKIKNVKKR